MNARPITWPTVPKGKDRVRVCLHAGNTKEDVERLVDGIVEMGTGNTFSERAGDRAGEWIQASREAWFPREQALSAGIALHI